MPENCQRKKRNRRQKQVEQERRIKRMSVFGLRIETRDDFEESACEDFQNIRREIKDKSQSYRIGPAPVFDLHNKSTKHHTETAPGSLDSDIDESMIDENLSPKYNEVLPSESEGSITTKQGKKLSKAGCRGLLLYFAKLGRSEGDEKIDLEFVDSLLRGGKVYIILKFPACNFNLKRLLRRCFPVIFVIFLRAPFLLKISSRLLLTQSNLKF